MPVGTITERYAAQHVRLKLTALSIALEATGTLGRSWHVPNTNGGLWDGDPHNLGGIAQAFDRAQAATLYAAALLTADGSGGDVMALKLQHDYVAMQERAYRLRHLSPIRAVVHAGARRKGHSTDVVGPIDRVTAFIADLLVAGAAGWIPPRAPEA
jgi:hypothetical protein